MTKKNGNTIKPVNRITPQPIAKADTPVESDIGTDRAGVRPMRTSGVGGTVVSGGFVVSKERNSDLTGDVRYRKFSEMLVNVAIVSAAVRYFLSLIAKADWDVIPAGEKRKPTRRAEQAAQFIDSCLKDMETPFTRVVKRAAMYKFYGFSVQEWTAKIRDDGKIGMKDIDPRPQHTIIKWDLSENGKVLGCVQKSPQTWDEIYLPRGKVFYLVDDSLTDDPEGLGLFRQVISHANKLMQYEKLEAIGFTTDLKGIPVGRIPYAYLAEAESNGKLSASERAALEKIMEEFISSHVRALDTGIILDSLTYASQDEAGTPSEVYQWNIELLKGGSVSFQEVAAAISRKTQDMAVVLGVEHLLLGSNSSAGSYALSKDKTDSFFLNVDSTLIEIAQGGDKDIVEPLCKLNGIPKEYWPTLRPRPVQFKDLQQIGRLLKDLAYSGAQMHPLDPAIDEAREIAGLPPQDETLVKETMEQQKALADAKLKATQGNAEDPQDANAPVDRRSSERGTIPGETDRPE